MASHAARHARIATGWTAARVLHAAAILGLLVAGVTRVVVRGDAADVACPGGAADAFTLDVDSPAHESHVAGRFEVTGRFVGALPGTYRVEVVATLRDQPDAGIEVRGSASTPASHVWRVPMDVQALGPGQIITIDVTACRLTGEGEPSSTQADASLDVGVLELSPPPPEGRAWVGIVTGVAGTIAFVTGLRLSRRRIRPAAAPEHRSVTPAATRRAGRPARPRSAKRLHAGPAAARTPAPQALARLPASRAPAAPASTRRPPQPARPRG